MIPTFGRQMVEAAIDRCDQPRIASRHGVRGPVAIGCAGLLGVLVAGCGDPAAEMNQLRQQFEQIPPQADRRMVAFMLGLPYAETPDHSGWLYFASRQGPFGAAKPQRMILIRFDRQDRSTYREFLLWRRPQGGQVQLHYELSWSDPQRPADNDFWSILQEKLRELAQSDTNYQLDSQPASYQFRAGNNLLVGMQQWQADQSRLVRLSASLLENAQPRVDEIIELSCRVRILSVGIEFDRPLMRRLE
jgi:hypothetical protein